MKKIDFIIYIFLFLMVIMLIMSVMTNDIITSYLFSSVGMVSGLLFVYNASKKTNPN